MISTKKLLLHISILQLSALGLAALAEAPKAEPKSSSSPTAKAHPALKDIAARDLELKISSEDVQVRGKHGVRVYVKNNTDRAVIFSGDKATATINGVDYNCMSPLGEFDDLSGSQPTFISDLNDSSSDSPTSAISINGLESASDLLRSTKQRIRHFSKPKPNVDKSNFGQRILWPGDSCSGTIMFPAAESLRYSVLKIPVSAFFDSSDQALATNQRPAQGAKP